MWKWEQKPYDQSELLRFSMYYSDYPTFETLWEICVCGFYQARSWAEELGQHAAIQMKRGGGGGMPRILIRDRSMQFNGVIFHRLSLVRIYLGQASGQVLQYKCTLSLYFTITVQSKVCALLVAGCCIFVWHLKFQLINRIGKEFYWLLPHNKHILSQPNSTSTRVGGPHSLVCARSALMNTIKNFT